MEYSDEIIEQRYKILPEILKNALNSAVVIEYIEALAAQYNLSSEETALLSNEVSYVLFGFVKPENFESQIARKLGLTTDNAENIAVGVHEKLFSELEGPLKIAFGANPAAETAESSADKRIEEDTPNSTREKLLHDIEDPEHAEKTVAVHTAPTNKVPPQRTEESPERNIIDNKLSTIVRSKPEVTSLTAPTPPQQKTSTPQEKYDVDPYREPAQ